MVQRRRMGYGGLMVGISIVVMFWVTDALNIGERSPEAPVDSLGVAPVGTGGGCSGLRDAAKGVMQARQARAAREAVAEVLEPLGEDGKVMLALAYAYPVHEALEDKDQAIAEFAEGIHAKCLGSVLPQ